MITAKNYAAQAEDGLIFYSKMLRKQGFNEDAKEVEKMAAKIKKAVHFALPDGGKILDDMAIGIKDKEIKLPFDLITCEFFVETANHVLGAETGNIIVNKRAFVAEKRLSSSISGLPKDFNSVDCIVVQSVYYVGGYWLPTECAQVIPCSGWDKTQGMRIIGKESKGCTSFRANTIIALHQTAEQLARKVGWQYVLDNGASNISGETASLLEMIEALSCSNVEQSVFQEHVKKGASLSTRKLPKYETKFFTIKASSAKTSMGDGTGTHSSPRQHLRRGHIRRLEKGNIWVNSCVVGNKENGVIDKQYRVTK